MDIKRKMRMKFYCIRLFFSLLIAVQEERGPRSRNKSFQVDRIFLNDISSDNQMLKKSNNVDSKTSTYHSRERIMNITSNHPKIINGPICTFTKLNPFPGSIFGTKGE